nr:hypothetical protein [Tanacetum cinerariifolium]
MRHDEMLGKSYDVTFKEINTRSISKQGDSVMANEEMKSSEDANNVSIGKEGLIDIEDNSKLFGDQNEGVSNAMDVDVSSKRKLVILLRGNNKLKYVARSVNDFGREIVEMDPMIEDKSVK